MNIPAGLLDDNAEFFVQLPDQEACYCVTSGHVYRVNDLPDSLKAQIDNDIASHPGKVEALVLIGYETADAQREKYCSCCFGGFDGEADYIDGHFIHAEFWPCPKRNTCPVEGILCNALALGNGKHLTKREIEVLMRIDLLDKEIADRLCISTETVKVHLKHIREKSGLDNKKELIKLACKKNLL